jgi:hypothetical protein
MMDVVKCIYHILSPKGTAVAKSRMLSWIGLVGLNAFLCYFLDLGPRGWSYAYPADKVDRILQANNNSTDSFQLENSLRLSAITKHWRNSDSRIQVCLDNASCMPVDALLRYLVKADAHRNKDNRQIPLLFELVIPDAARNPICTALASLFRMLEDPNSSVMFALRTWGAAAANRQQC